MSGIREPKGILQFTSEHYPDRLPDFATEVDARAFWDTHDSFAFWDQMEDDTDAPPSSLTVGPGREGSSARKRPANQRMALISLRFPTDMIEQVRAIAERRHLPYQTMLRSWVAERIDAERDGLDRNQKAS